MTSYKHLAFVKFCKMTKIKNQNGCWQRPDAKCANEKKIRTYSLQKLQCNAEN